MFVLAFYLLVLSVFLINKDPTVTGSSSNVCTEETRQTVKFQIYFLADSIYIRATELVIGLGNYTCYCCCCFGMEIQAEHIFMEKHTQEKLYFATATAK